MTLRDERLIGFTVLLLGSLVGVLGIARAANRWLTS